MLFIMSHVTAKCEEITIRLGSLHMVLVDTGSLHMVSVDTGSLHMVLVDTGSCTWFQ
jgi:hypothetical protein